MDNNFIELISTHSVGDKAIIMSILDAEDIEHYVLGEYSNQYLYNSLPYIFRVRADQADKAVEILSELNLSFQAYQYGDEVSEDEQEQR
jgi:hypothetical protein